MYLKDGGFAETNDRNTVRNCSLTNRPSESDMGRLDKEISMCPNATPDTSMQKFCNIRKSKELAFRKRI